MFEMILPPLADHAGVFNLFNYITFRAGGALLTAFALAVWLGGPMIRQFRKAQVSGQPVRGLALADQESKVGTPTMGGLIIWVGLIGAVVLWADLTNPYLIVALLVTMAFAGVGFLDDYTKLVRRSPDGLSGRARLLVEFVVAGLACTIILGLHGASTPAGYANWGALNALSETIASLAPVTAAAPNSQSFAGGMAFPFINDFFLSLGPVFIAFGSIVIVGWSNAVNFTDGLDGLAIVPSMFAAAAFALIAYMAGNFIFSDYLGIPFVPGTGELAVLSAALVGAGMGFLWYNAHPASVFMGDTGSLGIGGLLGVVAVAVKHEFVLAIIGGLFVVEILSVVSQVGWFRLTRSMTGKGQRIFRMAPLHHHFQKMGWTETHIVVRFWILSALFALLGLATLKLR